MSANSRDKAIDALCTAFPDLERGDAGALVDALTTCAAVEAGARTAEALVEPLSIAIRKHADGVTALLGRAHRELMGGERGPG